MSDRRLIGDTIGQELTRWGIVFDSVEHDGRNHVRVCFTYMGKRLKWSIPKAGGRSDPRAMLNNRSQLRNHLRRIQNGEATGR